MKKENPPVKLNKKRNFSLIELLVVIAIISILAGMIFGVMTMVQRRIQYAQTREQFAKIEGKLQDYLRHKKRYPHQRVLGGMNKEFWSGATATDKFYIGQYKGQTEDQIIGDGFSNHPWTSVEAEAAAADDVETAIADAQTVLAEKEADLADAQTAIDDAQTDLDAANTVLNAKIDTLPNLYGLANTFKGVAQNAWYGTSYYKQSKTVRTAADDIDDLTADNIGDVQGLLSTINGLLPSLKLKLIEISDGDDSAKANCADAGLAALPNLESGLADFATALPAVLALIPAKTSAENIVANKTANKTAVMATVTAAAIALTDMQTMGSGGFMLIDSFGQEKGDHSTFGTPFLYQCPGYHNRQSYDLVSAGRDGIFDTSDDINNWEGDFK